MSRGTVLSAGGADIYTINFNTAAAATTALSTSATTFTAMVTQYSATIDYPYWSAPWPCKVVEVYCELSSTTIGDGMKIALRKRSDLLNATRVTKATTTGDIIRNAYGAAAVPYVVNVAAVADTIVPVRYTGELQDTSVAPNLTGVAATETATGFFDANATLAAGDSLSCLYSTNAVGDAVSHLRVFVTVAKTEAS